MKRRFEFHTCKGGRLREVDSWMESLRCQKLSCVRKLVYLADQFFCSVFLGSAEETDAAFRVCVEGAIVRVKEEAFCENRDKTKLT